MPLKTKECQWILRISPPEHEIRSLQELSRAKTGALLDPVIAQLLLRQGIRTAEEARAFIKPELEQLRDPWLMDGMPLAADRILKALEGQEHIRLYGDYDVDGTTAVALMFRMLRGKGARLSYYVPDRFLEGYGLSSAGVEQAVADQVDLLIALDCGIKSLEQAERLHAHGVDLIICDHHLPGPLLPRAHAILNPKQNHCPYPFKELTGCGIAFKLLQALHNKAREQFSADTLQEHLYLCAMSVSADLVPIAEENRVMLHLGLEQIKKGKAGAGVRALLEATGKQENISADTLGFTIGPRINAAGRMEHASQAVELLLADDMEKCRIMARELEEINQRRREEQGALAEEAINRAQTIEGNPPALVVHGKGWGKGVVGLAASKLAEKFHRPVVVLSVQGDVASGSARSVPGFDLYEAIHHCRDLLIQFGGHKAAAGLSLSTQDLPEFEQKFVQFVGAHIKPDMQTPTLEIDALAPIAELDLKFKQTLDLLEPFGMGNPKPLFASGPVRVLEHRCAKGLHHFLQFRGKGGVALEATIWNDPDLMPGELKDKEIWIAWEAGINDWNGRKQLRLNIQDLTFENPLQQGQ